MLARLLYLLALTFLSSLLIRLVSDWLGLRSATRGNKHVGRGDPGRKKVAVHGRMVRDPVCGLNVPEELAVAGPGGHRFCSERCRNIFIANESDKRARA